MMRLLDMENRHLNTTALILGGGPSLPTDLQNCLSESILFAVNDHAFHIGVRPDYMVVMDDPIIKPELYRIVTEGKGFVRVNELLQYTDIDMRGVPRPDARSGIFAAWLAMYFGCNPILLCGMDLYRGEKKYCHDMDAGMGHKYIFDEPLETHLKQWSVLKKYPNSRNIRAVSGPLTQLFGSYAIHVI